MPPNSKKALCKVRKRNALYNGYSGLSEGDIVMADLDPNPSKFTIIKAEAVITARPWKNDWLYVLQSDLEEIEELDNDSV